MGLASTILAFAACAHAVSTTRRAVAGAVASIAAPPLASAGRVEEMVAERRYELDDAASLFGDGEKKSAVAKAVTESKLGVDVRRRVVRGAQLADALDARWDQLSFLVNANKAAAPPPRPPPPPVDAAFAAAARRCGDDACAAAARATAADVTREVAAARATYESVWEAKYPGCAAKPLGDPAALGFDVYCSFRAYNALLPDAGAAAAFEAAYGSKLLDELLAGGNVRAPRAAHASPQGLESCLRGCGDVLAALQRKGFCAALSVTLPDSDDLAELRGFAGWGDANAGDRPAPQLQLSALLADPPELRPRLLLEGQARRLGLRVLPDVASSSLRAYLVASGVRPTVEEYFVDDVYRTAFDKDDYSSIQLEVLLH